MALISMMLSCSVSDDNDSNDPTIQIANVQNTVQNGSWRITSFVDSGQNETSDFSGYNFTFGDNGVLTASNGATTLTGTWSVTNSSNSSSSSSSSDDDIDFNIFFPVPESNDFEDLNDDWDIVSFSSTRIELIDISGGNGGVDTLVFESN